MADGWSELHNDFLRKKTASNKRRQMELLTRTEAVREMYHGAVESVLGLYKDSSNDLRSWQHFRNAADKLTEMHKFMKFTVSKLYSLGALEGAASYSAEFFSKLRELSESSGSQSIPFEYLRDYLTEPGDPPPRTLRDRRRRRRAKRISIRYRSPSPLDTPSVPDSWIQNDLVVSSAASRGLETRDGDQTTNTSPVVLPSSSSSDPFDDPVCKRGRFSAEAFSSFNPTASTGILDSESGLSEDSAASSVSGSSSCLCGADSDGECLTDCSSSSTTNDDDDVDSVPSRTPSPYHSSPGFSSRLH